MKKEQITIMCCKDDEKSHCPKILKINVSDVMGWGARWKSGMKVIPKSFLVPVVPESHSQLFLLKLEMNREIIEQRKLLLNTKLTSMAVKHWLFVLGEKKVLHVQESSNWKTLKCFCGCDVYTQMPLSACAVPACERRWAFCALLFINNSNNVLLSLKGEWSAEDRVEHSTARSGTEWGCRWDLHQCCPHHVAGSTEWLVGSP